MGEAFCYPSANDTNDGLLAYGVTDAWDALNDGGTPDYNTTYVYNDDLSTITHNCRVAMESPAIPDGATNIVLELSGNVYAPSAMATSWGKVGVYAAGYEVFGSQEVPAGSWRQSTTTVSNISAGVGWTPAMANAAKGLVRLYNEGGANFKMRCTDLAFHWTWDDPPANPFHRGAQVVG